MLLIPTYTSIASSIPSTLAEKENIVCEGLDSDGNLIAYHKGALDFPDDFIVEIIQQLNEAIYLKYLENITTFGPRVTGTQACNQAGEYIYNEFQNMGLEVLYHYSYDETGCMVTLKAIIRDREKPAIESIAPFLPGAEWIEREIHDLLGIEFKNHPDMKHLILPDDWPEGVYPLRRDQ